MKKNRHLGELRLRVVVLAGQRLTVGRGIAGQGEGRAASAFDTGWGVAILLGLIVSVLAYSTGLTTSVTGKRMMRLGSSIQGRPPTPEEGALLGKLGAPLTLLSRSTAVLTIIAVGTMASARFI